jgi:glycerophosphoryl diester phosphodiesterase
MKISWKRMLLAGSTAIALAAGMSLTTAQAKADIGAFDFEAHRGGRDARPENTLYSFAYAMELGVTTLEMDMQLTKDGRIVISHNPILSPNLTKGPDGKYVAGGKFDIRTMTLAELRKFEVGVMNPAAGDYYEGHGRTQMAIPGVRIPTLDEVFELANAYGNTKVLFNIETKSYPAAGDDGFVNNPDPVVFTQKVYEVVKKYHMENRVMLQSFDWRTLVEMKKIDPNITTVALTCEQPTWGPEPGNVCREVAKPGPSKWMAGLDIDDFQGDYVKAAHKIGADVISPYFPELSLELIDEAHEFKMKVVPWTVNSKKDMVTLLEMGVDGMISDKPWLLREQLIARGIQVPAPTPSPKNPYSTSTTLVAAQTKQLANGGDAAQ